MKWPLFLALLLVNVCAGCSCIPEPATDNSPPSAGMVIEWHDLQGDLQSLEIDQSSANQTITADKSRKISVIYTGGDYQGLKSIHLDYDIVYILSPSSIQQPLLSPIELVSNCPRKNMLNAESFGPTTSDARYKFASRAKNWVGIETTSGQVEILAK